LKYHFLIFLSLHVLLSDENLFCIQFKPFPYFNTKIFNFVEKVTAFWIFIFTTIILALNIRMNSPAQDGNKLF